MKNKKLILVAVLAVALVLLMACTLSQVTAIEFVNKPNSTYTLNESVPASQFKIKISLQDGQSLEIPLTDSRLTVQGLVDGKLDTATVGTKKIVVSYQGISIDFSYEVTGDTQLKTWADNDVTGDGKTLYEKLTNTTETTITLEENKTYDLSAYQWKSVDVTKDLTINGNGATIKGLTITAENAVSFARGTKLSAAGFIGYVAAGKTVTIKNLTFEDPTINYLYNTAPQDKEEEASKNYGVVIGWNAGSATIENVIVKNAYLRGMGRIAGIIGCSNGTSLTVKGCKVDGTFVGYNPVTESSGDGEADKIAGILGQHQNGTLSITGCEVKVIINGTRDLGGIVGYICKTAATITGNKVLDGSVISATILGGMVATKGTRNVGGIVGTLQDSGVQYTITGNTFSGTVKGNSAYAETSTGDYVGGFRRKAGSFQVNDKTYVITADDTYFVVVNREVAQLNADLKAVNPGTAEA